MVKCSVLLYILKKSPIYPIVDEESNKNTLILYHIYLKKKRSRHIKIHICFLICVTILPLIIMELLHHQLQFHLYPFNNAVIHSFSILVCISFHRCSFGFVGDKSKLCQSRCSFCMT